MRRPSRIELMDLESFQVARDPLVREHKHLSWNYRKHGTALAAASRELYWLTTRRSRQKSHFDIKSQDVYSFGTLDNPPLRIKLCCPRRVADSF